MTSTTYKNIDEAIKAAIDWEGGGFSPFQISAALAAGRVIAEGVAQTPLKMLEKTDKGKNEVKDHDIQELLEFPNDFQTDFEFREMMFMNAVFYGDAFAYINRVKSEIRELIPFDAGQCTPHQFDDYTLEYEAGGKTYKNREVLHLKGPAIKSGRGLQIMRICRKVLDLTDSLQTQQKNQHDRGNRPDGVMQYKGGKLNDETLNRAEQGWLSKFGFGKKGGVAFLEKIWEYIPITQSSSDAQTLESREFQVYEICRLFGVQPQMVMQPSKNTSNASTSAFAQMHVKYTLQPWATRFEKVCARDLLERRTNKENRKYSFRHNFDVYLRGTPAERAEFYNTTVSLGIMTRAEAREKENLPWKAGLDEPLTPLNHAVGVHAIGDQPKTPADNDDEEKRVIN